MSRYCWNILAWHCTNRLSWFSPAIGFLDEDESHGPWDSDVSWRSREILVANRDTAKMAQA